MFETKLDPSKPVQIYRNLHNKTWSMRQNGKVVAHPENLILRTATFRVQPAGRAKVLRTGHKNVHAYVQGWVHNGEGSEGHVWAVGYNPRKYSSFMNLDTNEPVETAQWVYLMESGRVYARGVK